MDKSLIIEHKARAKLEPPRAHDFARIFYKPKGGENYFVSLFLQIPEKADIALDLWIDFGYTNGPTNAVERFQGKNPPHLPERRESK
jgi:hypothetical protein